MDLDPVTTNPELYRVVMENDRVRVLEYRDKPGDRTTPHGHPDSVMYTLSSFRRRLTSGDRSVDREIAQGTTSWLAA
ncbi:MAG TPA: cytoplasmic protein, partial [Candidatus Limnocylindria bacterium]|nr:cytoplasmic protein [Candidatus Limnocylindria bacterium]